MLFLRQLRLLAGLLWFSFRKKFQANKFKSSQWLLKWLLKWLSRLQPQSNWVDWKQTFDDVIWLHDGKDKFPMKIRMHFDELTTQADAFLSR